MLYRKNKYLPKYFSMPFPIISEMLIVPCKFLFSRYTAVNHMVSEI